MIQETQTSRALRGVSFFSRELGLIVGDSGLILGTTNGGALWTARNSNITSTLHAVAFASAVNVCAVGDSGVILVSNDSGCTWWRCSSGTLCTLRGVSFPDHSFGIAVGDGGTILKWRGRELSPVDHPPSQVAGQAGFQLYQNNPNPFNRSTTLRYELVRSARIRLSVYDAMGRELETIDEGDRPPGMHEVNWTAGDRQSGIYFVRLVSPLGVLSRSMILVR